VQLTPREQEKLLVYVAADLARKRQARGLRLNLPESVALITEACLHPTRHPQRPPSRQPGSRLVRPYSGMAFRLLAASEGRRDGPG
jgi:urease gamma subunit